MAWDRNLEDLKSGINLIAFAASRGYALDKQESSRNSAVMRHANGDKIIIARATSGHWVYFSVRDGGDNGTIIDFVQRRNRGASLGHVRRELNSWNGGGGVPIVNAPVLVPVSKDRAAVLRSWSRMQQVNSHPYLARRGLSDSAIATDRFTGTVLRDGRGNAIFPHADSDGICGYEIKNDGFTGFATGGAKALWCSNRTPLDSVFVVAESAIDAISHSLVKPREDAFYASTAGGWSDATKEMLRATVASLPLHGSVLLAFDQDEQGRVYVEAARELLGHMGRTLLVDLPPQNGCDWNDVLRGKEPLVSLPLRHGRRDGRS